MAPEIYYIHKIRKEKFTAGTKAPNDIENLCSGRDYKPVFFGNYPRSKPRIVRLLWYIFNFIPQWIHAIFKIRRNSILIIQYPIWGNITNSFFLRLLKFFKKTKLIILIHDLETLRGGIAGVVITHKAIDQYGDFHLLPLADQIICHNYKMNEYLRSLGIPDTKLINLELFDYLSEYKTNSRSFSSEENVIAIAGNLAASKSGYIYELLKSVTHVQINLYGKNISEEYKNNSCAIYKGVFPPEELISHLEGKYGLVWDGPTISTCAGNTGEYLRYNCPHKTSLYLAAGIPVIVWSQSAIAKYILSRNAGIAVDSLENIESKLNEISDESYRLMVLNAQKVSSELLSGHFFYTALDNAFAKLAE